MKANEPISHTQLQAMLTTCYELEGLIALAIERADTTPAQVWEMIRQRAATLAISESIEHSEPIEASELSEISESSEISVFSEPSEPSEISESTVFEETEEAEPEVEAAPTLPGLTDEPEPPVASKEIVLTLGDKYRFIRELFDGNDAEFRNALDVISDMQSSGEIEDYLYNDLCFDEMNPTVKEFAAIVTK